MQKRIILLFLLMTTILGAQEKVQDKWKVNLGSMFVTNFETEVRLTPEGIPASVNINTKDQLGMTNDTNVPAN